MLKKVVFLFLFLVCLSIHVNGEEVSFCGVEKEKSLYDTTVQRIVFSANLDLEKSYEKKGIIIEGVDIFDKKSFVKKMSIFLNNPINEKIIRDIRRAAVVFFQEEGYPFVVIKLPQKQDISQMDAIFFEVSSVKSRSNVKRRRCSLFF